MVLGDEGPTDDVSRRKDNLGERELYLVDGVVRRWSRTHAANSSEYSTILKMDSSLSDRCTMDRLLKLCDLAKVQYPFRHPSVHQLAPNGLRGIVVLQRRVLTSA